MIRLGLVGLGTWGLRYVRTIAARSDCRIAAFATSTRDGLATISGAVRCETWCGILEMARRGDLDAVVAATTPSNQAEIAAAAASNGVPLLVEKPLGASPRDVEQILRRFQESPTKAPIVVDYVHLFAPAYRRLKDLVEGSAGGTTSVISIQSEGCNRGPFRTWSPLLDYAPHDVAMCLDLLGRSREFRLTSVERLPCSAEGELFEAHFALGTVSIMMRVGNGAETKSRRFAVTLAGGRTIVYDDCKPHPGKLEDRGALVPIEETLPLDAALTHFLVQHRLWSQKGPAAAEGARWLDLSLAVTSILDALGRSVAGPGGLGLDSSAQAYSKT